MQEIPGAAIPFFLIAVLLGSGITIIQPNQAVVVTFFGKYLGTIRSSGLFLTIPLTLRKTISLRVRNFNSKRLKVNDVDGNQLKLLPLLFLKLLILQKPFLM